MDVLFSKRVSLDPATGCWLWTGTLDRDGYGKATVQYKQWQAHRLSYVKHHGQQIPPGALVCHKCDVRRCVNPDHLFLGTHKDNIHDMVSKGRKASQRGVMHSKTSFTEAQVLRVAHGGEPLAMLAREFGVSFNCVWEIRTGITWSHTTGIRRAE